MQFRTNSKYSDEQLIEMIRAGNEQAFSILYNRYWDKLYILAYHRLSSEIEAEEVVQDLFLSIWLRKEELQIKSTVSGYLSVSIKYQVINQLAKRKRQATYKEKLLKTIKLSENTTDLWLSEKELREKLERHINQLPEKCRLVFRMSREEGKNVREISEELNLAEKTIEAHITKALKVLKGNFPQVVSAIIYLFYK